uniref:Major sperm protein n=1 Tax=Caenorhabditis tropicalis TaxID=1561998 RepID=A0A1I7TBB9_9PELO
MDIINKKCLQKERSKLQKAIEQEYETTKEWVSMLLQQDLTDGLFRDMIRIRIEVEPTDVEITSVERNLWEHEIVNFSSFDVVCRVRATNSKIFSVNKNGFLIKANESFILKVSRCNHRIRSHHLKVDVTKYTETFQPNDFLDYFVGPYAYKTFVIRYHGAPKYRSDALEMNRGVNTEQLDVQLETDLKRTSKERKSSLETSEISSQNEQEAEEDLPSQSLANMNIINVMIMAMRSTEEAKKEGQQTGSDDSDLEDTLESEKNERGSSKTFN